MSPPVRDNIYVAKVSGIPTVSDVKPVVSIQLQTERRVERLACVINVNARNADSHFPYIMQVNVYRTSCTVEPHIFDYNAFTHILPEISRYNVRSGSGNGHSRHRYDGKQKTAKNWRNSPLITQKSLNQFFHFSASHEEF
jgi:hypothetical protein